MKQSVTVLAKTSNDDLHLKYFNAIAAGRRAVEEREQMQRALMADNCRLAKELANIEAEAVRKEEQRKERILIAAKLFLLLIFGFVCTISAFGCFRYGLWWAAIAPIAFLVCGLWQVGKSEL